MNTLAQALLGKLLLAGEMSSVGRRSRQASLTESQLSEYRAFTSLPKKESFEETMKAARASGALELIWDGRMSDEGFIKRINLTDLRKLASFLGARLTKDKVEEAGENLQQYVKEYPVLTEVLARWATLRKIRGLGSESYLNWVDAIQTIQASRHALSNQLVSLPVREFSGQLFKDSKRIENLIGPLDILLSGTWEEDIRTEAAVLQELGLFREEHPVMLAGCVVIERERVTSCLDKPYIGLPAPTILRLASKPLLVMTIENLTTFHSEARRRSDEELLLIYTAGMPSPAWRAMYRRLLVSVPDVPIYHWGDVDEGGFRIAATLARDAKHVGHILHPWKMHPEDVPEKRRRKARPHTLERILYFSSMAGWLELGAAVASAGFTVEQESIGDDFL